MIERRAQNMGLCTFKGGVHPYDGKELSKDKPIRDYLPKGDLVYPLSQQAVLFQLQSMQVLLVRSKRSSREEPLLEIW